MSKSKKALIVYLVVSSVILHGVVAYFAYQFGPAMKQGYEMAGEFAKASAGQAKNVGIVKDVCKLQEGDHGYVGYALDYRGQSLYVMGSPMDAFKVGDQVAVTVTKHPYGPLKSLLIVVTKNGR